jgi:hypothetical protein
MNVNVFVMAFFTVVGVDFAMKFQHSIAFLQSNQTSFNKGFFWLHL